MLDRTKPLIVAVSLTAIIAVVSGAEATVIFDNFDAGGGFHATDNSVAASANRSFGFVSATRAAAKFTVSGGDISLDSVTLPISEQSSVSGDFLRVRLAADAGGAPGATVEVLSENASIWPPTSNPFTTKTTLLSTTHPLLSDGASYWIVTELTSFPAGDPISVDYRWFMNKSGSMVPARQQQQNGGGLPSDPWTGFSGSLALAFRLAGTRGATTYTWNVASGSWAAAGNWAPPRTTPATNDILVFDGTVTPSATVTDMPNDETLAQLRVQGSAQVTLNAAAPDTLSIQGDVGDDFVIDAGSKLELSGDNMGNLIAILLLTGTAGRVSGEFTVAAGFNGLLPTDPGSLTFESGSHCRTLSHFKGHLFGDSGANGVVVFRSGATYHHGGGQHPFGLAAPNSRVVWETGSLCRYFVPPGTSASTFAGRIYADCEINATPPAFTGSVSPPCTFDHLTVISGGFASVTAPWTLNIKGNLVVLSGGAFFISPPNGTATVNFIGTGAQTISLEGSGVRLGTFTNLDVINPSGLTLGRNLFSHGTVTLSGGHLITGPYLLHLGDVASIAATNHWVIGNLGMIMPGSAGTVTRTFEIGDATRAAPVTVSFASVSDSGTVVARTDAGDHPDLAASGLDPNQSVNRTWKLENLGVAFTTCDVMLGFDPADVDPGASPSLFRVGKRDGSTWSLPAVGTRTSTSTQAVALTAFSEFAVAEESGQVSVDADVPGITALAPARPTPFQASTVLEYSLARRDAVDLAIYGVDGRRICTLERGERGAGRYRIGWDGRDNIGQEVAAGVYFARLLTGEGGFDRRVIKVQ